MSQLVAFCVMTLLCIGLFMLITSRLEALIKALGLHGIVLGVLALAIHADRYNLSVFVVAASCVIIKGVVVPLLLTRALESMVDSCEKRPPVGYTISIFIGIAIIGLSFWLCRGLSAHGWQDVSPALIATAASTVLCGLFLLSARRQVLTLIIGYLLLENGLFVLGIALPVEQSLIVELGVLLDVMGCVFILGVVLTRISREFDSTETAALEELKQ